MTFSNPISNFDVVVIGGGAAGISSALWCGELGLKTLLLEANDELGGQLLRTFNPIDNYLGAQAKNGSELRDIFVRQIENRSFTIKLSSAIAEIDLRNKTILFKDGERVSSKALIIATGVRRRSLDVEGEKGFQKKGIIESGKRDQNLVKDKNAAVIGGGDAAFENALILAEAASRVTLVHRNEDFRSRSEFVERVQSSPKIKILTNSVVEKFIGNEQVEAIEIRNLQTKEAHILSVEAVLIRIGVEPNTEIFRGQIELDKSRYFKINQNCETNLQNIFAVGDVANPLSPTISSAVGMGATAAKVIAALLHS
ncbi:MAG: FAD-dependent oxidoreductase [Acidobacteriota bacterium]